MRRRPGFTLLELVLAMALGTVIVGVAWALMYSADRADRAIEENGVASAQLERARLATTRMAASILMSPGSDPRRLARPESTDDRPSPRRRNRVGINPDDPLPTPRIMLTTDLAAGGVMTPERTGMDPALLGERMVSSGGFGMGVVPQRLEIVLVDPPVPTAIDKFEAARRVLRRNAERNQRVSDAVEGSEDAEALADAAEQEDVEPDVAVRAFRGAFQFRPQAYTDEEIARMDRGEAIRARWQLEWQPLMPRGLYAQDSEPPEAVLDGPARVIATDLAYANWIFFQKGERTTEFTGTWGGDLPAYVELELETANGMQVNWMFEVGWAFGPEVPPVAPAASRIGSGGAGGAGGGAAGGGAAGGGAAGGGTVPQGTPGGTVGGDTGKPGGGGGSGGRTGTVKGGGT